MSGTVRAAARRTGRARRWWTAVAGATSAVVAALAVLHPGAPVAHVDLHDGAVWVTSATALALGRYNTQVEELNAGLATASAEADVLQQGGDVLLVEPGRVAVVDPASVAVGAQAAVPAGADVGLGGGVVSVTDARRGAVWARTTATLGTLVVASQPPDLELGRGGLAVTTQDGVVLGVHADGTLQRGEITDAGAQVEGAGALAEPPSAAVDAVTAVGPEVVALAGSRLHTPARTVDLTAYGSDPALQQPGPASDHVLVATRTALLEVPLGGGPVTVHRTGGDGVPASPVRVGACGHGAWASATGSSMLLCDGEDAVVSDLEGVAVGDSLVFRVNRDVVVLNDVLDGRLWVPTEDPRLREPNWQDITPHTEGEQDGTAAGTPESTRAVREECTPHSAPLSAVDDTYGVRAGRTTVLSVIDNDASSDCGILAISDHDEVPESFGTLVAVDGGRSLQLTTTPEAAGTVRVTYTVTDGRGTTVPSTATVTLTVHPDAQDSAPVQVRPSVMVVEQGARATYDVRPDFRDPDGDHLVLTGADTATGGTARTRPDGLVTFQSDGSALGRQDVRLRVSDGTHTVEGTLVVDIRAAGSLPPLVDPVHAVTSVDQPVVVRPLESVRSSSREPVRLAGVEELPGATLVSDLDAGTFTFTAPRAGTYYVTFVVTAAPQQATGIARVDVRERPEEAAPPIAALDVALLPPGGEVTIDPLANDVDPAGGVLVLQSVEAPEGSGLGVATVHHELLRITSDQTLVAPVTLTYRISNGAASAAGQVLVQPLPRGTTEGPPVVPDVTASVRTGGVVTIPVLDGAYDPDGDPLTLVPELPEPLAPGEGLLFVSGDALRYQAPDTAGEVRATFGVRDPAGTVTAATVTVTVHSSPAATKAPPRPRPLTARALEAGTVRIPVPLTGIDPDGDGVRLLGPADAPRKGRIVAVGPDWLEYEALPGELGTDTFTYAVEDWVGQRAVATVQVGIAARGTAPAQVLSRNDDVTVRPGRTVEVRVLANDVDSDGGELSLDPDLRPADGVVARAVGPRVVVQTPDEAAQLSVAYVARNSRGGQGTAVLTVHVSPDAPIAPPVARDVVVPATETFGRTSVRVDVLAVAENPSGPLSDLRVGVHPSASDAATVAADGAVVVTLLDRTQTVPYSLTSADPDAGASTYAFITVPALGDFPPVPRPRAPALRVVAGETLRIPLEEQVQVAPGRTPRIADVKAVSATKADGAPLVADSRTLVYTAQRGYAGPASISVDVTDGEDGDPTAHRRVLTLPITVLAAEEHPPTFSPSVLDVGPGEAVRVDLAAFTSAPVETTGATDRYVYRLTSAAPDGFRASLSGSVLVVEADADVARGTAAGLSLAIDYGGGSVPGHLDLRVVASSRPLARVLDHGVPDGAQGRATTVAVLEGAYNPFPGAPLALVAAVVETPASGTATVAGSDVLIRPAAGFVGTMVTRYRVRDVTGDPDREVEARVTVVVRGRPAAPTAPRVVEVLDRAVVLAWDAPAANGDPVTGYTVVARPGDVRADCPSTTCTVTGLANGVDHTFTVTATNGVGTSDPSPASVPARPDAGPLSPAAPQVTAGDGRVDVRWTPPENPGSPIRGYDVEISPAPAGGLAAVRTAATTYAFTGLTNGTRYTVRVRALNDAPSPGAWSAPSAPARPAGLPGAPAAVTVTSGHTGTRTVTVSWQPPPGDGGDPVTGYRVVVDGDRELLVGADRHSTTFEADLGRRFEVAVQARNTVGWSPAAVSSGEVWGTPAAVTGLTATDVSGDGAAFGEGRLRVGWSRPATSGVDGQDVSRYLVLVDGRHTATVDDTGSVVEHVVGGLAGGRHSVEVVPVNVRDVSGPVVAVAATVATVAQGVTFSAAEVTAGRVTFRWSAGGDGGTPVTGYRYLVERDGRADVTGTQAETSLAVPVPGGDPLTVRITVWALNARGESVPVTQEVTGQPAEPEPDPEPEPGATLLPEPGPEPDPDPEPEP